MAAIFNLEFTRIDNEVNIYINGRLRASNFAHDQPKINVRYQFYVEKLFPTELTIVFYYGQKKPTKIDKPWKQARMAFTLHKSGSKRPMAIVHDYWDLEQKPFIPVREFNYQLVDDT